MSKELDRAMTLPDCSYDLLPETVAAMKRALPVCREQIEAHRREGEGYDLCRIAVQMLPFWEFVEKYHETDPDLVMTYLLAQKEQVTDENMPSPVIEADYNDLAREYGESEASLAATQAILRELHAAAKAVASNGFNEASTEAIAGWQRMDAAMRSAEAVLEQKMTESKEGRDGNVR